MKVWFPTPATGTGSQVFTSQLAAALRKRGIEPIVTTYPKHLEAMPWLLSNYKLPDRTDLVHLGSGSATGFLHHPIPSVITAHGAFERADYNLCKSLSQKLYHSLFIRPGIRKAVAEASIVTAVSTWVADIYRQEYGASEVQAIHNWIDTDLFSPIQKQRTRKILFVGRKAWQKGSHLLPKIAELLGNHFELTCTLSKSEWPGSVPSNTKLVGPVSRDRMPVLYQSHDALIVPSIAEGFCLAAAEAMACGLPVFGFRGHGLDEVLGPISGLCSVGMSDVMALVDSIQKVFDRPHIYREVSEVGRQHVECSFTETIAVNKYISLYQSLVPAR